MLPEVAALRSAPSIIRVPECQDIPVTDRIRRLIDTMPMRRLASISQLGMVSLVYPGATHSRLEHSLGVYHLAVRLLSRFSEDERLADPLMGEAFLVAALVHDVGHWPYCHPIEDMRLTGIDEHENRIASWLRSADMAECLDQDWSCDSEMITSLLVADKSTTTDHQPTDFAKAFYASCLSGPIDIDKLDYLERDSLHAGVPYGRNFDSSRLIHSMCVHPERPALAIRDKGRTAAELMVFARYVMFSEIYWHHTVRSATAMLQRTVFLLQNRIDLESSFRLTDHEWTAMVRRMAEGTVAEPLTEGLFGPRRILHKRLAEFDIVDGYDLHMRLARRPYWWLVACSERLAELLSTKTGVAVHAVDVLIDAPPVKLEVDINIDVVGRNGVIRPLGEISPMASALAKQQFDHHVKRVRIFVRPDLLSPLRDLLTVRGEMESVISEAIDLVEKEIV